MEKLSNDEMIKIIIQLKFDYEKQINNLTDKCNALEFVCSNDFNFKMTDYDKCNFCEKPIYDGIFYYDDGNETGALADTYMNCYICKKKCCFNCEHKEIIVEYRNNPLPNLFYCIKCYNI
jgi:hypothetical protein